MDRNTIVSVGAVVSSMLVLAGAAAGQNVSITFENTTAAGGGSFTPYWFALHNGGFDSYDGGSTAAGFPGLEELAEEGDTGPISAAFAASPAGMAGGVDGTAVAISGPGDAPVLSPGESVTVSVDAGDSSVNRWFSYASMVVPTNDLFVGNGNPFAHEVFDASGNFNGPVEILLFGSSVNDAGTEVNDAFAGAAFSTNGGTGVTEDLPVRNFFTVAGDVDYLDSFLNTGTADGGTITTAFGPADLIGRITVVPAPSTAALVGLGGLAAMRRRR